MIPLTIAKITELVDGAAFDIDLETIISADFSIDSRAVNVGGIFIAIKGEKVDGRDFATQALTSGALCVLTEKRIEGPCIVTTDVVKALGEIAHYVRRQIPHLKVIGITGSQGKTTTKDLLAHVLSAAGKTHAAKGSYNNDLGAPLTLLECQSTTKYCIVEMGARHPGDIARLTQIAEPNVGVVLKVGNAHIGEFGSRENIARTKKELIDRLPKLLPKSTYHGDFTLENILYTNPGFYMIDPVTIEYDSYIFDIAKMRQDLECKWFLRDTDIKLDTKLQQIQDKLREEYPQAFDNSLLILMLLRVYLHTKQGDSDRIFIMKEIKRLWK